METVNIDAQKLQLLNDRIAQTIDALNQVRLSSQGLQHSVPQLQQQVPQWGQWGAFPQHLQQQPQMAGFAPTGAQVQAPQQFVPMGIEHTAPAIRPNIGQLGLSPLQQSPYGFQQSPIGVSAQSPFGPSVYQGQQPQPFRGIGISHTPPVVDPFSQHRAQPFPYAAQSAYPQGAYPQGAYPQSAYPQSSFPQSAYPQSSFPQSSFPQVMPY